MKRRTMVLLMIVAAAAVLLGGCAGIFGPPAPDLAGDWNPLGVDGDGHFRNEVTYESPWETETYTEDGSVTFVFYELEDEGEDVDNDGNTGEGRVITGTREGTYTYDPDKPEITWEWSTNTEGGQTDTDLNWTETRTVLMTSNGRVNAFVPSEDNPDQYVYTRRFTDRDEDGNVTYHDENTNTFTIGISEETVEHTRSYMQGDTIDDAGPVFESEVVVGDVATYPVDESWSRGATMTFSGSETTDRSRSRDSASDPWPSWNDEGLNFRDDTFVNYGSFMTYLPNSATQSVGGEPVLQ